METDVKSSYFSEIPQYSSEFISRGKQNYSGNSSPFSARHFFPIIKLAEKMSYSPWNSVRCSGVVIKAQELLSKDGRLTNGYYQNVVASGGLHSYLGYYGTIILSSIMPDKMLNGFTPDAYGLMIQRLQPDYFMTPDGATYLGKEGRSMYEINRMITDTEYVISICPESTPIGLVKGCTAIQNKNHVDDLKQLGISRFVFHAGDYLVRGGKRAERKAIEFANVIRERVPWFLVYGIASTRMFLNFRHADGFVTQGHIVNTFYGRESFQNRFVTRRQEITRRELMHELSVIKENMSIIYGQTDISDWITANKTSIVNEISYQDRVATSGIEEAS